MLPDVPIYYWFVIPLCIWILSGFLFGNALWVKNGRIYFIAFGDKVWWSIKGTESLSPIWPLPFPFRVVKQELTYTEYVKHGRNYDLIESYENVEKAIGTITESVHLREIEMHPIVIEVVLNDGYKIPLILDTTIHINTPRKILPLKEFMTYIQQEFSDVLSPWANKDMTIESIVQQTTENIRGIDVDLENGGQMKIIEYLNKKKFEMYGFSIGEISYKAGLTNESKKYFAIRQAKKEKIAEKDLLIQIEENRNVERATFKADADTEREVQQKDLVVVREHQKALLTEIYNGQERVAKAYQASTLIINGGGSGDKDAKDLQQLTTQVMANLITNKQLPNNKTNGGSHGKPATQQPTISGSESNQANTQE